MVDPSPNWPKLLLPQQTTVLFNFSAHEWSFPVVIEVTSDKPLTGTAVGLRVVVPSPTWPVSLSPQQATVPSNFKAHEWKPPAATIGSGKQTEPHKNVAIWPRVTTLEGENFPGEVPDVIPSATSHVTAR